MSVTEYRRRAENLLTRALKTTDLRMRGLLLDEAVAYHQMAVEAHHGRIDRPQGRADKTDGASR